MIRILALALSIFLTTLCAPTPGEGAEQTILGRSFVVKDPSAGSDPRRRTLTVRAKDRDSSHTVVGNPAVDGATLEVVVKGANPTSQTFDLPAAGWTRRDAGQRYTYRDPYGAYSPVKMAHIRRSRSGKFTIRATIDGQKDTVQALDVLPPGDGTESYAKLSIVNGDRYCMKYGADGRVRNRGAVSFRVDRPVAEGCYEPTCSTPIFPEPRTEILAQTALYPAPDVRTEVSVERPTPFAQFGPRTTRSCGDALENLLENLRSPALQPYRSNELTLSDLTEAGPDVLLFSDENNAFPTDVDFVSLQQARLLPIFAYFVTNACEFDQTSFQLASSGAASPPPPPGSDELHVLAEPGAAECPYPWLPLRGDSKSECEIAAGSGGLVPEGTMFDEVNSVPDSGSGSFDPEYTSGSCWFYNLENEGPRVGHLGAETLNGGCESAASRGFHDLQLVCRLPYARLQPTIQPEEPQRLGDAPSLRSAAPLRGLENPAQTSPGNGPASLVYDRRTLTTFASVVYFVEREDLRYGLLASPFWDSLAIYGDADFCAEGFPNVANNTPVLGKECARSDCAQYADDPPPPGMEGDFFCPLDIGWNPDWEMCLVFGSQFVPDGGVPVDSLVRFFSAIRATTAPIDIGFYIFNGSGYGYGRWERCSGDPVQVCTPVEWGAIPCQ